MAIIIPVFQQLMCCLITILNHTIYKLRGPLPESKSQDSNSRLKAQDSK